MEFKKEKKALSRQVCFQIKLKKAKEIKTSKERIL
jgi:hypothetical protein